MIDEGIAVRNRPVKGVGVLSGPRSGRLPSHPKEHQVLLGGDGLFEGTPEVTYLRGLEELAPNDRNTLNKANHTGICSKSGRHPAAGLTPRSL